MKYTQLLAMAFLSFGLLTLTACDKEKKEDSKIAANSQLSRLTWSPKAETAAAQLRVLNQFGEPIAGAQILIGHMQGSPFRDNFVTTNASGTASISNDWRTPAAVTVSANGYIRQTFLSQRPGNMVIRMSTAYLAQRAEVRGQVTQLPVVNNDKLIDFALAMPIVTRADLLNFDLGQVISPYTDTLSAAGQSNDIPSNVSLPRQRENYFIGVTLEKPVYRLKVPTLGPKKFVSARGRFVFKKVVDELRAGKPFYDTINHFSILGGGIREATITGPLTNLDIPGNELEFTSALAVQPATAQADEVLLVLATNELAGAMIPTDVKKSVGGAAVNLQSLPNVPAHIVTVVKKQSDFMSTAPGADRMSASLLPYSANTDKRMLPLIANPSIATAGVSYVISLPALNTAAGINPTATSAVISDLIETKDGNKTILTTVKRWEIIGPGWNQRIELPQWALDAGSGGRKRVEVNYVGSVNSSSTQLDETLIQNATHVTHASTDF